MHWCFPHITSCAPATHLRSVNQVPTLDECTSYPSLHLCTSYWPIDQCTMPSVLRSVLQVPITWIRGNKATHLTVCALMFPTYNKLCRSWPTCRIVWTSYQHPICAPATDLYINVHHVPTLDLRAPGTHLSSVQQLPTLVLCTSYPP